mmetsp:Transcript_18861/g.33488  ORF Transcript_18861/g.33488 Transcript_18861/m.33488 type:complete len:294 (-) Transcript_18861:428-1309(-)
MRQVGPHTSASFFSSTIGEKKAKRFSLMYLLLLLVAVASGALVATTKDDDVALTRVSSVLLAAAVVLLAAAAVVSPIARRPSRPLWPMAMALLVGIVLSVVHPLMAPPPDDHFAGATMSRRLDQTPSSFLYTSTALFLLGGLGWLWALGKRDLRAVAVLMGVAATYLQIKSSYGNEELHSWIAGAYLIGVMLFVLLVTPCVGPRTVALMALPYAIARVVVEVAHLTERKEFTGGFYVYYFLSQLWFGVAFCAWVIWASSARRGHVGPYGPLSTSEQATMKFLGLLSTRQTSIY